MTTDLDLPPTALGASTHTHTHTHTTETVLKADPGSSIQRWSPVNMEPCWIRPAGGVSAW